MGDSTHLNEPGIKLCGPGPQSWEFSSGPNNEGVKTTCTVHIGTY